MAMAILTPYESRAGIATANAGQAAPYRSASAFMTPGAQANLERLSAGLDRLGNALGNLGLERLKMQNATDLLADKVAYEDALREFDSSYRKENKGASARNAEQAYAAFHKEQFDKLQQKWGGNPFLMEGVSRMAEGIRLPSMQRAVAYRDSEEEAYQKSVLQASQAQAFALFGDPSASWAEKQKALADAENNLRLFAGQKSEIVDGKIQWTGGKDVTAESMALRQRLAAEHFSGLMAAGNLGAAQAFLNAQEGTASAPGGTSERNLAAFNFGNVKNSKGNFVAYASREDGLMGHGERVLRYANAPERGWHAESLLDMVNIYAPKGDGANDPEAYAAFLGKKLGLDPRAKIDFRDPKILAGLIKWMPVMEHGAKRVNISDEESLLAAKALLEGKKPHMAGEAAKSAGGVPPGGNSLLSAAERFRMQASIDAAQRQQEAQEKQAQEAEDASMAQRLIAETQNFTPEEQQHYLMEKLAAIPDPERRGKLQELFKKEKDFQDKRNKAKDMDLAATLVDIGRKSNDTPNQFLMRITATNAPESAKKLALDKFNGKLEENELNMRALDELRLKIDQGEKNGQPMSKDEIYSFAHDRRMTIAQIKSAFAYLEDGGNRGKLKQSDVNAVYRELNAGKEVKEKDIPAWLFEAVSQELEAGKPPTRRELKTLMARLLISGTVPGRLFGRNSIQFGEAVVKGQRKEFEKDEPDGGDS